MRELKAYYCIKKYTKTDSYVSKNVLKKKKTKSIVGKKKSTKMDDL